MGLYDTMQQGGNSIQSAVGGMGKLPNAMGQGFAQQKPPTPSGNGTMQSVGSLNLQSKPVPAMGAGYGMQKPVGNYGMPGGKRPTGMATGIMNAYQAAKQQKPIMGGGIPPMGGSMGQESPAQSYGQPAVVRPDRPQSGLANLQSPLDAQRAQELSPMAQAAEQMRGYDGPDLGSQDPRELARTQNQMQGMTSLYGSSPLQAQPFGGEESPGFQEMTQRAGIGPSQTFGQQIQMDENGLEPRRGAR